jgi:hypothetical protein
MTPDSSMAHIHVGSTYTATPLKCVEKDAEGFWCTTPGQDEPSYYLAKDAPYFAPAKPTSSISSLDFRNFCAAICYLAAAIFIITRI